MGNYNLLIVLLFVFSSSFAQENSEITYFKKRYFEKEVKKEKANYAKIITKNNDTITTDEKSLSDNKIIESKT